MEVHLVPHNKHWQDKPKKQAVYKLKRNLLKFHNITVSHTLELFDKLVAPILSYASQCWAFCKADAVERVHTQFCKSLLGVKPSTQNDFIYGELGRIDLKTIRIYSAVKIWLKYFFFFIYFEMMFLHTFTI